MLSQYKPTANSASLKTDLRVRMRELRAQSCPYDREAQSLLIVDRLVNLFETMSPQKAGLYLATALEVNLDSLIDRLYAQRIEVYLPNLDDEHTPFRQFLSWENVETGPLGLRHPPADSPSRSAASLDVIVVPGLAFDRHGNRLGQGGGWYDKALDFKDAKKKPVIMGVCFDEQLMETVPSEPFDVRMDIVVTPSQLAINNEQLAMNNKKDRRHSEGACD